MHGGVLYTLVDFAMGGALTFLLGPGERCATLEVKVNFLAPALSRRRPGQGVRRVALAARGRHGGAGVR